MLDVGIFETAMHRIEDKRNWWGMGKYPIGANQMCALQSLSNTLATCRRDEYRADPLKLYADYRGALNLAASKLYGRTISGVNDFVGHEAVMHCYREVIKEFAEVQVAEEELVVAGD